MSLKPNYGHYSESELSTMSAMDLLQVQVQRSNSLESRLEGLRRISLVASLIGSENGLRMQLLPWLKSEFLNHGSTGNTTSSNTISGSNSNTTAASTSSTSAHQQHHSHLETDEDEVLLCLATQLGKLSPYIGDGDDAEDNLNSILSLLEYLCGIEETVVREEAVRSIRTLLESYDDVISYNTSNYDQFAQSLVHMCNRLAGSDWFPSKVCAAGVIPTVYTTFVNILTHRSNSNNTATALEGKQSQLRQLLSTLIHDENPLVRRSCARHLPILLTALIREQTHEEDVLPMYRTLLTDESDTVRLLAIGATAKMCTYLQYYNRTFYESEALEMIRDAVQDASWRVRDATGKVFGEIVQALCSSSSSSSSSNASNSSNSSNTSYLCTLYSTLLADAEAEVRASAVSCLGDVTRVAVASYSSNSSTSNSNYQPIASVLPRLSDDTIMEVRRNLAREIMRVAPELDGTFVLQTYRTVLETLVLDEAPEVQLAILTELPNLGSLLPSLPNLVGSLLNMTNAANWRVRLNCALMLSSLCQYLGTEFYLNNLATPFYNFLLDSVAEVRCAVIATSTQLAKVCGYHWCNQHLLPNLMDLYVDPSSGSECYLTRITILRCAAALIVTGTTASKGKEPVQELDETDNVSSSSYKDHPALVDKVLTFLIQALEDKVANVRLVAARSLGEFVLQQDDEEETIVAEERQQQKRRVLDALHALASEDEDEDCKFYSRLALDAVVA